MAVLIQGVCVLLVPGAELNVILAFGFTSIRPVAVCGKQPPACCIV